MKQLIFFVGLLLACGMYIGCTPASTTAGSTDSLIVRSPATDTSTLRRSSTAVPFTLLRNYFVHYAHQKDSIAFYVAGRKRQFDSLVHPAAVMGASFPEINYDSSMVAAIVLKETNLETTIRVDSVEQNGDAINVWTTIKQGVAGTAYTRPLSLFSMLRPKGARTIMLYNSGQAITAVPLPE